MQRLTSHHWQALIFFGLCFCVLWLLVEPHLIYHGLGTMVLNTSLFSTGWQFFADALRVPGGLTHYVSGFLSQLYGSSWLGPLVILLVAVSLCELLRIHLAMIGTRCHRVIYFLPALIAMGLYSRYTHPLAVSLALSFGLQFSLVLEKLPWCRAIRTRVIFTVFMMVTTYCVAGFGGTLVFTVITALYQIGIHKKWFAVLVTLPLGGLIIWGLTEYVYCLPPKQAISILSPLMDANSKVTLWIPALYALGPVSMLLVLLKKKFWLSRPKPKKKNKKADTKNAPPHPLLMHSKQAIGWVLPFVLLALCLQQSFDRQQKLSLQINYAAVQQQWPDVLDLARTLPKGVTNVQCNHIVNRALYHTGRLAHDMFDFPQMPQALLLTHEKQASNLTSLRLCDLFLELGYVNIAEKQASELLAVVGHLGPVLENLALVNIVKDRNDTARIYLNALKRNRVYRDQANTLLAGLDTQFSPDQAATIQRIRANRCPNWSLEPDTKSVEQILAGLLTHNPANQMAFEYVMACYLLTGQIDKSAALLERTDRFTHDTMPAYYEEAMLIYLSAQRKKIDLDQYHIRRSTFERYERFIKLRQSMQSVARQTALSRLISEFGNTFLFYYSFGRVGF
jgi:hypothetical protein